MSTTVLSILVSVAAVLVLAWLVLIVHRVRQRRGRGGFVLRSTVRRAGVGTVSRHWPGTPNGLSAVLQLARIDGDHMSTGPALDASGDATRADGQE
ncbi:MAG: hypothetical protein M3Y49_13110 [Actinomycetota bacterium]|nr:hypothetical protein [Actinomycetota bacterium]